MANNADYGLSLQKRICECYKLYVNATANGQFTKNYNSSYEEEIDHIIPTLFQKVGSKPVRLLTYSKEYLSAKQNTSPHNFLLANGKTLSIRTTKSSDKIAPRTLGQAGFPVLNDYFADVFGREIETKSDVRELIYYHIHEILPIFIEYLFLSDITVILNRNNMETPLIVKASDLAEYEFDRSELSFTRDLDTWVESTTLKYHGISIAEIQTHKDRSFKFRFIASSIQEWFRQLKITTETLGMSAEAAICDEFNLKKPESFLTRVSPALVKEMRPVVRLAFMDMPKPAQHTGSTKGERGEQSKCSYDFILENGDTLSLKTNTGSMVCPPEVGQPSSETCLLYFQKLLDYKAENLKREDFKALVLEKIEKMMPIYLEHLFDSDWLLWITKNKEEYAFLEVETSTIESFVWEKKDFSFTKNSIEEWNESNTVKYKGKTIGEFQVHKNRNCYKFRFHMKNLLELINWNGRKS